MTARSPARLVVSDDGLPLGPIRRGKSGKQDCFIQEDACGVHRPEGAPVPSGPLRACPWLESPPRCYPWATQCGSRQVGLTTHLSWFKGAYEYACTLNMWYPTQGATYGVTPSKEGRPPHDPWRMIESAARSGAEAVQIEMAVRSVSVPPPPGSCELSLQIAIPGWRKAPPREL